MRAYDFLFTAILGAAILCPHAALVADDKPTLYDRNRRNMQSQGQYSRGYSNSYSQDRGSQRNYYNSRDYYYDDYNYDYEPQRDAIGRPPSPFR